MNILLRKLFAATGLGRRSPLGEATQAIQRALARQGAAVPTSPTTPTTPTAPIVTPRASTGRFVASSFAGAGGTRSFKLFEPAGFEGKRLPLVVMLHGCTQDADDFAAGTRMNVLAQERGLFVLYPEQAPRSNAHKCWNWFVPGDQRRGQGEPALIAAMTREVMDEHAVDADRVYVAGLSAGGAMAAILAREYPDLFAAAGIHSGLAAGAAHDVASAFAAMHASPAAPVTGWATIAPVPLRAPLAAWPSVAPLQVEPAIGANAAQGAPVIVFHGDADATVHAQNGVHVVNAALGSAAWQATREAAAAAHGGKAFSRIVYRDAADSFDTPSRAEHWVVHGAAHAWSGGNEAGSFTDAAGPDASREMLRFFAEHPLRHETAMPVAS